ncbi:MAG: tetratricopeptide repeat protein [Lachnospiraceae bacterium]|nr:tetratricopeptide repeat protein [Lachnospiraceae bacterium]
MDEIKKDEYVIKPCTTCSNQVKNIDMERIRHRLDKLFDEKDFDEAEALINYWLKEAHIAKDLRSELELQNEYIGFLRKQGRGEDAKLHAKRCIELVESLSLDKSVSGGTIFLNVATVYKAFGEANVALSYFLKAKEIYEKHLDKNDKLIAGLYNNMGLALTDLSQFDAAYKMYSDAITIMGQNIDGELDKAISHLNLADLIYKKYKSDLSDDYSKYSDEIENNISIAWNLLNKENIPHDDYYRFVCEKCAPSFGFYGYFIYEKELKKRANER